MSESHNPEIIASPHVGRHVLLWLNAVRASSLAELETSGDAGSVLQVMKLWVRLSLIQTRRRPEIAISSLLNHVLPVMGQRPVADVTRLQLNRLFNILIAEGKKEEARRVFALCKQFFAWAEMQGYIGYSPLSAMKKRDVAGRSAPPGNRTLSDAEVWVFWHGLDAWDLSEQCRWALRLCLLTARRPDEVVQARKEEFNLTSGLWRQGTRNKSQREHVLPLTPLMRTCIDALMKSSPPGSPWLVPSPVTLSQPLSRGAITQVLRRMIRADRGLGIEPFTTRDLRRSARSRLAALNTPNDVARKIMNHALEGIDRVYDTHNYLPQMQLALNALSDSIERIIAAESYHVLEHRYPGEKLQLDERALLYMEP
ncbi:site-specific integrase [Erwinia sp. Eh17-17]|jgi:integrase|uniref:tyrosine-type recombinase/integrase n=1 Tax=Erwinia sp. Eh17-17 TaxID=3080330 RepID=UPI0032097630